MNLGQVCHILGRKKKINEKICTNLLGVCLISASVFLEPVCSKDLLLKGKEPGSSEIAVIAPDLL